jgi:hypothetical protein
MTHSTWPASSALSDSASTRRQFLQLGAAAVGGLSLPRSLLAEPQGQINGKINEPRKKLIAWGWDTAHPAKIQVNIRKIEEMPWDGIVLSHFKAKRNGKEVMFEWRCFGQEQFEREHLSETIETLKHIDFRRFTDNFLRFNVQPGDVDWFDDFSAILHNARLWAEVARETRMKGWKFDVEDYTDKVFTYRKQKDAKQKSFEEYAKQARLRGRQLMEAIEKGYPDIVILLSLAHSYVNRTPRASQRLPDLPYGLLPAFLNGMIEAAGPQVRLIDGQEQAYGYLTAEDYFRGYHSARQQALALVPSELWGKYRDKMDVGMAMWANYQLAVPVTTAKHWPPHYMTPQERLQLFEQNIYYALKTTDEYVWLYSEQMGWWEPGYPSPTPDGAIDAIRRARAKIRSGEPVGFDMAGLIASAQTKMEQATKSK